MFQSVSVANFSNPTVVVIGLFQDQPLAQAYRGMPFGEAALAASQRPECTGKPGAIAEGYPTGGGGKGVPGRVIVVGLGKKAAFKVGELRNVAAAVGRRLAATKETKALFHFGPALEGVRAEPRLVGRAIGEALGLLAWNNESFKGTVYEKGKTKRVALQVAADKPAASEAIVFGLALAQSVNMARQLSETPPNIATPAFMAKQAQDLAKRTGMKCTVFAGAELEKQRLTGHIEVGKASVNKPAFIRLEYRPRAVRKGKDKPIVLIGKTMCYDTGGLSLKVNNGMVGMKRDKDGGCAVLGAMNAIATLIKPDRPVVAFLCAAENSVSDVAYRPDDVITYRNGVTVEVTNTDAEGRLVLADGLCWACEKENPAAIIDLATLTGGVVVALGSTYCGMFCEDEGLRRKVEAASETSSERVWRLPMHAEYRDMMKSPVADILNSNPNRKAHPIQGAAFLSYFVDEKIPWCHLDIAGVHASEGEGPFIKGPTGWGVRILADLAAKF